MRSGTTVLARLSLSADILPRTMHGEATIHRHATILRRGLRGIISLLVACTVAAFVISGLSPRIYEAKATILVGPVLSTAEPDLNRLLAAQRLAVRHSPSWR